MFGVSRIAESPKIFATPTLDWIARDDGAEPDESRSIKPIDVPFHQAPGALLLFSSAASRAPDGWCAAVRSMPRANYVPILELSMHAFLLVPPDQERSAPPDICCFADEQASVLGTLEELCATYLLSMAIAENSGSAAWHEFGRKAEHTNERGSINFTAYKTSFLSHAFARGLPGQLIPLAYFGLQVRAEVYCGKSLFRV